MARTLTPLSLAALALALFGAWMHWAVLDPRNVAWLLDGNDRGQNSLGLIAYLRARPPWPSLHDPLLMAPEGLGVALTDSNPLLAVLLRPFAGWLLPDGWQYTGLWLLGCVVLQVAFAARLVRPFVADRVAAFAAIALLAGTPVLFARFGHINLCAHWLILWALSLFVDPRLVRSPLRWAALVAVAWLVHPYLLVMVAAIWASAQLRLLAIDRGDRRATLARAVPAALMLVGVPWLLGYFAEPFASTGTYGAFGMALDALWNPGDAMHGALLPGSAPDAGQAFEGYNYLGVGLLVLLPVALVGGRAADAPGRSLRPLLWLLPASAALAVVAIGPHVAFGGRMIAVLPLSRGWSDALDPVRASGRLFWPAYYALAFFLVARVGRMRGGGVLLVGAACLQIVDIGPMVSIVRRTSAAAAADRAPAPRLADPRWAALIARASTIEIYPHAPYRDLSLLESVAWRAITAPCRPVPLRYFYASREPRSVRNRLEQDAAAFARGAIDPTRLYVLLDAPPAAVAERVRRVDDVAIIPPSAPAARPAC